MMHDFLSIDGFAKSTKEVYSILMRSKTPEGTLQNLGKFMKVLEKDNSCKRAYKNMKERMKREDIELQGHKQLAVDWMQDKLRLLYRLKFGKSPEVKKSIDSANLILSGKTYEISSAGYLHTLMWYFERACEAAASYGDTPEFDGWLKVMVREKILSFEESILNKPIFNEIITPYTKHGKEICRHLGHGFIKVVVHSEIGFSGEICPPRYSFEWGMVDSITYPHVLQTWQQSQDLDRWHVQSDHRPEPNFRYLLFLCQIENLKPVPLAALPQTQSVFEAESICNHQRLQYYLSGFKTVDWAKAPVSREYIMSKVDRLLIFLQAEENSKPVKRRGARRDKEEAAEFVQKALNDEWNRLESLSKRPRVYQDLRTAVFEAQSNGSRHVQEAISTTLVENELREFAKSKKWKPVRGRDQGERHVN